MGLLLLGGAVGIGGAIPLFERRARRNFITRVRTEWTRAGQVVKFGPAGAFYYGSKPQRKYMNRGYGALAIMHNKLVFEGYGRQTSSAFIRLEAIRWIGIRTISGTAQVLIVHSCDSNTWAVHTFAPDQPMEFGEELSRSTDLPLHQPGMEREDYGPARATRLNEDIYGEWSEESRQELYLAPDRLLFGWEDAILLSQIRQVSALMKGGVNLFAGDLLRIEYESSGPQTVGFLVRGADKWAEAVAHRAGVPLDIREGRKKKDS